MSKILYIDTSSNQKIIVTLKEKGIVIEEIISPVDKQKAQVILPLIDSILKKCHTDLNKLTGIEVNIGPGSFTGLRVGISVANALSYSLKIPVNNKKVGVYEEAKYD